MWAPRYIHNFSPISQCSVHSFLTFFFPAPPYNPIRCPQTHHHITSRFVMPLHCIRLKKSATLDSTTTRTSGSSTGPSSPTTRLQSSLHRLSPSLGILAISKYTPSSLLLIQNSTTTNQSNHATQTITDDRTLLYIFT